PRLPLETAAGLQHAHSRMSNRAQQKAPPVLPPFQVACKRPPVPHPFLTLPIGRCSYVGWRGDMSIRHQVQARAKQRNDETIEKLKDLADEMSFIDMRQIVQRDATLKLILLLPEAVL